MGDLIVKKIFSIIFLILWMVLVVSFPIIGKNMDQYSLVGKTIYVDAGHGGKDNGAYYDSVIEDEINLNICKKLIIKLIESGAYVLSTRSADYDLSSIYSKNKKREDLKNRVKNINNIKPDIFISVHLNTYSSSQVYGAQVFHQIGDKSKLLSTNIQDQLNSLTGNLKKSKIGDYFILNNSESIGVIVECGFITNENERRKLSSNEYQDDLSMSIFRGITNYFASA